MSNRNETEEQIRVHNMHQTCKHHMYYHVIIKTSDGQQTEGIITDLDKKHVYMLVPQDMMPADEQESPQISQGTSQQQTLQQQGTEQNQRQWHERPRYRRFYRQIFPLVALTALSLYPYYPPYPYPYPYYPYPYPYPYPYY